MAWRSVKVEAQRMRFLVAASSGEGSLTGLCAEFGISRPTGYLWLERYRADGVAGVAELSRLQGRTWQVSGPLAGEAVQLIGLGQRVLVFYRHTLVREIDLASQGSTAGFLSTQSVGFIQSRRRGGNHERRERHENDGRKKSIQDENLLDAVG